jgi:hypothetical protein
MTDNNTSTWYNSKTPSQPHSRFSPEAAPPSLSPRLALPRTRTTHELTLVLTFTQTLAVALDERPARHARRL